MVGNGNNRPLTAMKCNEALQFADGRETWLMTPWPMVKRWEQGENQAIMHFNTLEEGP